MTDNPYSTPEADISGPQSGQGISQEVVDKLTGTRPWVLFLAILAFIGSGFMVLGGLVMMIAGSAVGLGDSAAAGFGVGALGLIYIVMAAIYLFPAIFLSRFASRIKNVVADPSNETLVVALEQQRKFWKFMGVMVIVSMVLGFAMAIAMPIFMAATGAMSGL